MDENIESLKELVKMGGFVGLAQIDSHSGNLKLNSEKIIQYIKRAEDIGLDMILFPKNVLLGNLMEDFIDRYPFILQQEIEFLEKIAESTTKIATLISFIDSRKEEAFALIRNGKIEQIIKEVEYITSKLFNDGVEFYIKPVSIPSRAGLQFEREFLLSEKSKEFKRPILEINQVGATDSFSYSGESLACDENGNIFARAKSFEEQLLIVNPFRKIGQVYSESPIKMKDVFDLDYEWDLARTYKSIVQSIKKYFNKCGLKRAVLGLSGGLDSSVCAVLLTDALGKENVFGVSMPSKLTSNESKSDALELARNLGIGFSEISIKPMFDTTEGCLNQLFSNVENLWKDYRYKESFTPDNIQARSRAIYLWGIANEFSSCVPIATSDKSELYMGYATINGDMSGGFAPIADVTKTKLFALARWINKNREIKNVIPESIILKRPGAELAIDPNTGKTLCAEDALMPYEFLDEIIWRIENKNEDYKVMINSKFLYEVKQEISFEQKKEWLEKFYRRMSFALYKSAIMPPYPIIDSNSINKNVYYQPITSSSVNYINV